MGALVARTRAQTPLAESPAGVERHLAAEDGQKRRRRRRSVCCGRTAKLCNWTANLIGQSSKLVAASRVGGKGARLVQAPL